MMNTLLDTLSVKEAWQEFLGEKKKKNQLTKKELKQLETFIAEQRYRNITDTMCFGYPEKKEIVRFGSSRKRIVYSYSAEETWVLKLLAYRLYKYDDQLSDCCYSFRHNRTARTVFDRIQRIPGLDRKYVLKLDIHDYFNSIDAGQLVTILQDVISDDPPLLDFLCTLLLQNRCIRHGEVITEERGAMAGVPLAGFFANLYLRDLDRMAENDRIPFFRYSDDMLVFFDDPSEMQAYLQKIISLLAKKKLTLNMEKYHVSAPGEPWEFLGFRYHLGKIDLAEAAIRKMQGKIYRRAHRLYRNRRRKKIPYDRAAAAMIRSFDNKFYDLSGTGEYTWTRYYFPVISCTDGLQRIDRYMVMYLRYLSTGRHTRSNYRITYEHLKKLGYTPLVHEYYTWKKENRILDEQYRQS